MESDDDVRDIDWYGISSLSDHARIVQKAVPDQPIVLSVKSKDGRSDHWFYSINEVRVLAAYLADAAGDDIRLPGVAWRWRCPRQLALLLAHSLRESADYDDPND